MQNEPSPAPLHAGVGRTLFALINNNGSIVAVGLDLDSVTRHLDERMPPKLWNGIFTGSTPEHRASIYAAYGWRVERGRFAPNTPNHMPPAAPTMLDGGETEP